MGNAIGMIELTSIARGVMTCDSMLKAASVSLVRASTVCPGKYMIIVAGDTGAVRASMEDGKKQGGEYIVDTLFIPNVHQEVIPAITGTNEIQEKGAVGVIEFYSVASAINAADIAAKAANVSLMEVRIGYAIGGKGFVSLTGDVGAVKAAISAAEKSSELYVESTVLPRPEPRLFEALL